MKKILVAIAIFGGMSFAACNQGQPVDGELTDSIAADSVVDTTVVVDSVAVDTIVAE